MESLRTSNCVRCGRSEPTAAAWSAAGMCSDCAKRNTGDEATKRQALGQLLDRYREARTIVSSRRHFANLDWVLGAMGNPDQTASDWANRTIELAALWLEDLATEMDRLFPEEVTGEIARGALSAYRAHRSLAQDLRDATERFVVAFRRSEATVRPKGRDQRVAALLTRGFGPESFSCVMCDHEKSTHTVATDGAGWCGEARGCECGGFQESRRVPGQPDAWASLRSLHSPKMASERPGTESRV